ncbi:flagellar hook-associated protein FlgK [Nocardioides houyundeii]|uniref:flagellar hook-associated protein FlgK n=1 Tax=Nocardioides houyundeii TaxID=2045452 RepID=UPI000DF23FD2|nr:flagellar hook-associated protein FlgK [Nocardioides houyundeii]
MSGSFASFSTALSALSYNRVVMDTASSNIANAGTAGYSRRRVESETVAAPGQIAMWSRYEGSGEGVAVAGLQRMTDEFLNTRARQEHANLSYLGVRSTTLQRLETGIAEPGAQGVSARLAEFRASWHDLANNPGKDLARTNVLTKATSVVEAVRTQATNVAREAGDARSRLEGLVTEVNTGAAELAELNRMIAVASASKVDTNGLADQRDVVAMRLSELTGATATRRTDGGMDLTVNGVPLVTGAEAGTLVVATGSTGGPVSFAVRSNGADVAVAGGLRGATGATADLLTVTLPAYAAGLDAVVRDLADQVNALHAGGYDSTGAPGGPVFAYDPADPSGSLTVAITDPALLAASGVSGGAVDGSNADLLTRTSGAESAYQRLVGGLGTEVASTARLVTNQSALVGQVDGAREQLSGVNLDEEMVSLLTAQRAYEAASRVMTTMDSMLDTLINRTGLVGR